MTDCVRFRSDIFTATFYCKQKLSKLSENKSAAILYMEYCSVFCWFVARVKQHYRRAGTYTPNETKVCYLLGVGIELSTKEIVTP